jgi:hypothetical protein
MKLAKYTFIGAGIYGLIMLLPQYFLEAKNGINFPPVINHPEYYYGFVGVGIAWQIAFLIIGKNPVQYRMMMLAAMVEKFSFGIAVTILFVTERVGAIMFGFAMIDVLLGILFVLSYWLTKNND